eukprot:1392146-Heterocapsa_arctica.AAC.1
MLKNAEAIEGWDDKVEEFKAEIKEHMKLSNQEQNITREAQGTILLQQVQWNNKEKAEYKKAMLYHQQKTDQNAKFCQKMKEEIRNTNSELEEIGWNQVVSDEDLEDGES